MQKRIALWDNLKLFLIFTVVLGHLTLQYFNSSECYSILTMIIYTFHMPAFVFVSGLFSKHSINNDKPPVKKAFGFIIIYFFMRILNYIPNVVFGVHSDFEIFYADDAPWYMMAMALWYIITYAIRKIDTKYILIKSVVLACFAPYMTGDADFLVILRLITFYPFFYAGYCLEPDYASKKTSGRGARIFSGIFVTAFCLICIFVNEKMYWLFPLLTGRRKYSALGAYGDWGVLFKAGYYIVAVLLIFSIISLCPRKNFKISGFGSRTLQIYVFHRPFLYLIKNAGLFYLIRQIGAGWEAVGVLVCLALTALLCFGFWGKPLKYLMNPKEKKEYAAAK